MARLLGSAAPLNYCSAAACKFGLSLFFTLSAFLICELLLREREAVGTVGVKQFYIRRILRIWPLYYYALALGAVFELLPGGHPANIVAMGWFAIFLGAWRTALRGSLGSPVDPLWSISVEEQFYLFAPWVVKFFNRKSLYAFCAVLILASNLRLVYLSRMAAQNDHSWYDAPVQFECFAGGILLCLVLHSRLFRIRLWQRLSVIVIAWGCWLFAAHLLSSGGFQSNASHGCWPPMSYYALAVLGSVLILVAFLGINPKLLPGWIIYLGRISFGLYIFHIFATRITDLIPIGRILKALIPSFLLRAVLNPALSLGLPLALTIGMAAVSYRFIETPFLKMKKRHAMIESQPVIGDR